jgi:hypothetical protein
LPQRLLAASPQTFARYKPQEQATKLRSPTPELRASELKVAGKNPGSSGSGSGKKSASHWDEQPQPGWDDAARISEMDRLLHLFVCPPAPGLLKGMPSFVSSAVDQRYIDDSCGGSPPTLRSGTCTTASWTTCQESTPCAPGES